jgi:hypothetical protein
MCNFSTFRNEFGAVQEMGGNHSLSTVLAPAIRIDRREKTLESKRVTHKEEVSSL